MINWQTIKEKFNALWADGRFYRKRLGLSAAVMLAFCFTFLFFGPLEIVAFSGGSLVFTYLDVVWLLLGILVAVFVVVTPLLALLRGRIFNYVLSILAAIVVGGYLQALLLNGGLGLLTGDSINWSEHAGTALLGLGLWIVLLVVFLLVMYLHRKVWRLMLTVVSLLLVVMQIVPTIGILTGMYDNTQRDGITGYHLSEKDFDRYGQGENIFVFVLDRLDYDYINRSLKEDPHFLDGLDGFTSYTNAISAYARTQPALTHMFTGAESITYRVPESQFFRDAWNYRGANLLDTLQQEGYTTQMYSSIRNLFSQADFALEYVDNTSNGTTGMNYGVTARKLMQLSAFRYVPTVLKPFFWADTNYYNTDIYYDDGYSAYQFDDPAYAAKLRKAEVGDAESSFKLYHFFGPHAPYTMNADGTASQTETSVTAQTIGSFTNLISIFQRMKELGIYEDATILILGDHGAAVSDLKPLQKATRIGLFYKPAGASGTALQYSSAPVSAVNIPATLAKAAGGDYTAFGTPLDEVAEDATIVRRYYKTVCDPETFRERWLYTYEVTGDAADFANWKLISEEEIPYSYN